MGTYTKTTWTNGSGQSINAVNLNKIEQGIYDVTTLANLIDGSPGNNKFLGTNSSGTKAFYDASGTNILLSNGSFSSNLTTAVTDTQKLADAVDDLGITSLTVSAYDSVTAGKVVASVKHGIRDFSKDTSILGTNTTTTNIKKTIYISDNKFLFGYSTNSLRIGTISGTTISYGTVLTQTWADFVLINSDRVLVVYASGTDLKAVIVSVSGNSLSAGTAVNVSTGTAPVHIHCGKLDTNKGIVSYALSTGLAKALTVSDTTITVGASAVTTNSSANTAGVASTSENCIVASYATDKAIVLTYDTDNLKLLESHVITASGTVLTNQADGTYYTATNDITRIALTKIVDNRVTVAVGNDGKIFDSTISATYGVTSTSYALPYTYTKKTNIHVLDEDRIAISNSTGATTRAYVLDYNNDFVVLDYEQISASTVDCSICPTGVDGIFIYGYDGGNGLMLCTDDTNGIIGISTETKAAGQSAKIDTRINVNNLSGLISGYRYYVDIDGTLSIYNTTLLNTNFRSTKPLFGVALSTTELIRRY